MTVKLFCERCQRAAEPSSWSVVDGTLRLVCSGCGAVSEQQPKARTAAAATPPIAASRPAVPFAAAPTPMRTTAPPQLAPRAALPQQPRPAPNLAQPPLVAAPMQLQPIAIPAPAPTPSQPIAAPRPEGTDFGWLEEGWDRLRDRWTDDEAHTRLVSEAAARNAFAELGTRYRRVLEGNPEDPHALRARDELVRRATAHLMTTMPREERGIGPAQARTVRNAMLLVFLLGVIAFGAYVLLQMGGR